MAASTPVIDERGPAALGSVHELHALPVSFEHRPDLLAGGEPFLPSDEALPTANEHIPPVERIRGYCDALRDGRLPHSEDVRDIVRISGSEDLELLVGAETARLAAKLAKWETWLPKDAEVGRRFCDALQSGAANLRELEDSAGHTEPNPARDAILHQARLILDMFAGKRLEGGTQGLDFTSENLSRLYILIEDSIWAERATASSHVTERMGAVALSRPAEYISGRSELYPVSASGERLLTLLDEGARPVDVREFMDHRKGVTNLNEVEKLEMQLEAVSSLRHDVARKGVPSVEAVAAGLFGRASGNHAETSLAAEVRDRLIDQRASQALPKIEKKIKKGMYVPEFDAIAEALFDKGGYHSDDLGFIVEVRNYLIKYRVSQILPGMEKRVRNNMRIPRPQEVGMAIFGEGYKLPHDPDALEQSIRGIIDRLESIEAPVVDNRKRSKRWRDTEHLAQKAREHGGESGGYYGKETALVASSADEEGRRPGRHRRRGPVRQALSRLYDWRARRNGYVPPDPNARAITTPPPGETIVNKVEGTLPLPDQSEEDPDNIIAVTEPVPGAVQSLSGGETDIATVPFAATTVAQNNDILFDLPADGEALPRGAIDQRQLGPDGKPIEDIDKTI